MGVGDDDDEGHERNGLYHAHARTTRKRLSAASTRLILGPPPPHHMNMRIRISIDSRGLHTTICTNSSIGTSALPLLFSPTYLLSGSSASGLCRRVSGYLQCAWFPFLASPSTSLHISPSPSAPSGTLTLVLSHSLSPSLHAQCTVPVTYCSHVLVYFTCRIVLPVI